MAQRESARMRLGLAPGKAVAAAGVALAALLGALGAARTGGSEFGIIADGRDGVDAGIVQDAPDQDGDAPAKAIPTVVIHIDGAVEHPGVYALSGETVRVCDAVDAAGGLAGDADTSSVNLAQPVGDGAKIHIPALDEPSSSIHDAQDARQGLINLNTAGMDELMELPGVGEATARAIIDDRERLGPFASVDDLLRVSGIGEKKLEKIRPNACV